MARPKDCTCEVSCPRCYRDNGPYAIAEKFPNLKGFKLEIGQALQLTKKRILNRQLRTYEEIMKFCAAAVRARTFEDVDLSDLDEDSLAVLLWKFEWDFMEGDQ